VTELAITHEDFQKFGNSSIAKPASSLKQSKSYFVDRRLIDRIEATGHANFRNYFTFLRFEAGGGELQALTNA